MSPLMMSVFLYVWEDARIGTHKISWKDLTIWRPVLPVSFFLEHRVPHSWFSPWTLFRAVESQQLQWPWFNLCRCRWQVSIINWQSPFLLTNLTMILREAFHDHFIPWCWECPLSGLAKILLTGHSMCCYWTRPLNSIQNSLDHLSY